MRDHQETQNANAVDSLCDPARPGSVLEDVGFEFEHEQQAEPGEFVDGGGEGLGPLQEAAALAQGMGGVGVFLGRVKAPVQQQQPLLRLKRRLKWRLLPIYFY